MELGCGAGANIPFFKSLKVDYYAIDGSKTAVQRLWNRFPEYHCNIITADFTNEIPFNCSFDLIVDRASLTHNNTDSIIRCLELVRNKLRVDGLFIGIDWFSTFHSEYKKGTVNAQDIYTRRDYKDGPFTDTGIVHFADKEHMINLFRDYEIVVLEHKIIQNEIPDDGSVYATWNIVARRSH